MKIAIVGHEESKFTRRGKSEARREILDILDPLNFEGHEKLTLISGGCHLGGIDIWAEELSAQWGHEKRIFKPQTLKWDGGKLIGYKQRNIQIAKECDVLYCIAVQRLADSYKGMKFTECYHCHATDHVKGGGCWTMKKAKEMGKEVHLIIIPNQEGP